MMVPLDPMGPPVVNGAGGGGGGAGAGCGTGRNRADGPTGAGGGINTISIATVGTNAPFRQTDDDYRHVLMRSKQ